MIENGWLSQARFHKGVLLLFILGIIFISSGIGRPLLAVQAQSGGQAGSRRIYLPNVFQSAAGANLPDLAIQRVEVTQAVQDANNSVPLVAGRSTLLRIYAVNAGGSQSIPGVNVAIVGGSGESLIEGAQQQMTAAIHPSANPALYSSTINFLLPPAWTSGSYDLRVSLDSNNAIAESNEGNNTQVVRLNFNAVPPLRIMIVPIAYTSTETGTFYSAPTDDTIRDMIQRMYPVGQVEVTWHAPYAFTGNLKELGGFSSLLSQINALKTSEQAPSTQVYYALVPTRAGASSWFQGGLVGLGYIGSRAAVGLDYSNAGATAAHEIGHNLGRYHAPCGNPSSPDAAYPYPGAVIGQYGLDLVSGALFGPNDGRDIMSYCAPKWVSDYTYQGLMNAMLSSRPTASLNGEGEVLSGADSARPVWLVRAQIGTEGADFFPIYPVDGVPTPAAEASPYRLQWIGLDGALVSEAPYAALEIATETDAALFEVQALVEIPAVPVRAVRLMRDGVLLAEQVLQAPPLAQTGAQEAFEGPAVRAEEISAGLRLYWDAPGPVMVRFSADGGRSWQILAADVSGGMLLADASLQGSQFQVIPAYSE